MLLYQTRSLSQKGFFSGGNGELEFLIVVSSSFFCSLLWWPLLLGLVSIWHYKAVFGKLCGTNSGIHVLTGFLCFLQMDRGLLLPPSSLIVLHAKIWHSYSSNCSFSICSRYCSPLQNVGFPAAIIHSSSTTSIMLQVVLCYTFCGLSWIPKSPLFWGLKFSNSPWKPASACGSGLFAALILFILVGVAPRSDTAKSSGHLVT